MSTSIYKTTITNSLTKMADTTPVEHIYGGITEHSIEARKDRHTRKKPLYPPHTTKIRALTTLKITHSRPLDVYKAMVKDIENHLINTIDNIWGRRCTNDSEITGRRAQTGGAGSELNYGDEIKFYVMYN